MRSLFLKIFLSFWLIVTLAGGIMGLLTYLASPEESPILDHHLQFASKGLDGYAREAKEAIERFGVEGWRSYVETLEKGGPTPYIITGRRQTLSGRPVPPLAGKLAGRILRQQRPLKFRARPYIYLGQPLKIPGVRAAALVVELKIPKVRRPPPADRLIRSHFHGERLFIFLVIGGIICFLLARSLTSPIRKLRVATQRFAGGNFATRVSGDIRGSNEIADLARDFDRMAERIEASVDAQKRLHRDISHELRSPLARLNVALELARQRSNGEAQGALDRIEVESERLNEMIGQILSLSLLESGSRPGEGSEIELSGLLEQVVADADFEARSKNRRVVLHVEAAASVNGSPELLRRALENVVRNAVHYTAEGTAVEVELQRIGAARVEVRVRDHGPGVGEADLEKIFRPFHRVAPARDRQSGGTGLGLAIAARAVQLHGGHVSAANAGGGEGGLEVTIELPVSGTASACLQR